MPCEKFTQTGLLYASGELDSFREQQYQEHLKECPECRESLQAFKQVEQVMHSSAADAVSPATRHHILARARRRSFSLYILFRVRRLLELVTVKKYVLAAAAALLVIWITAQQNYVTCTRPAETDMLAWDDDFYRESMEIEERITTISDSDIAAAELNEDFFIHTDELEELRLRIDVLDSELETL